ncbi:MAG TPA: SAM-dependent methyltransferase [Elusimicrobiota bacterium]|nr:SAM-dependent methyltransferase [Elusimicrobiota bacterium]
MKTVPPAKDTFDQIVRREIRRRGRVSFAEFMSWALYHPQHGYYMAGPTRLGRAGDYFTSVQTGMMFGRLLCETFFEMWSLLGGNHFSLVELGAADGSLAEQILRTFQEKDRLKGLTYYLVEKSPAAREAARRRLSRFSRVKIFDDIASLEHISGMEGCVFSNEFFDALPIHRVVREKAAFRELYVHEQNGVLSEEAGPPSTPLLERYLAEQRVTLEENQKAEICLALEDVVSEIERVLARGFVFSIDYGEPSGSLYRPERTDGTLQVTHRHALLSGPFEKIGEADITAFVDFGRLAALGERGDLRALVFAPQGPYLVNSAQTLLKEIIETKIGRERDVSLAAQVQQLIHPQSLGGRFSVLIQGKNVGRPELSGGQVNRLRRLLPEKGPS